MALCIVVATTLFHHSSPITRLLISLEAPISNLTKDPLNSKLKHFALEDIDKVVVATLNVQRNYTCNQTHSDHKQIYTTVQSLIIFGKAYFY